MVSENNDETIVQNNLSVSQQSTKLPLGIIIEQFQSQNELYDGIIRLPDGSGKKVHQAILSACSLYFKLCFKYYNRNFKELAVTTINLDCKESVLNEIIQFAYTEKCCISWLNVEDLLVTSDRYGILKVLHLCCKFLEKNLNWNNCIEINLLAKHYFCRELEQFARKFIVRTFSKVITDNEEITNISLEDMLSILNDDYLNVATEKIVFEAIKKWINLNISERSNYLQTLLKCVRFGRLKYEQIHSCFQSWELTNQNSENEIRNLTVPLNDRFRIPNELIMIVGGWSKTAPTNLIEIYDTRADSWLLMKYTDSRRAYHGTCIIDHQVYIVGGFDGRTHFNTVRCFDTINYRWEDKACMSQIRCYVSVVVHGEHIYALGGYNGQTRLNSVERYDPQHNKWELLAPMRQSRSDAGAAVMGDFIYIAGGFNGEEILNSCELYCCKTNCWTFIPEMLNARSGFELVAHRSKLYAIGGFNGNMRLDTMEKYSIQTSNWILVEHMMVPRSNFASALIENKIYAIGGYDGNYTISFVECYDIEKKIWKAISQAKVSRSALSACVLTDLPNMKGYSYYSYELSRSPCISLEIDKNSEEHNNEN